MKKYFLLFILFLSNISAHYRFENVTLDIMFLPEDLKTVYRNLETILDLAKREVWIAMYWLTYEPLIDKLISLKQRGIDVKIILDESSYSGTDIARKNLPLIAKLIQHDIVPLISPSKQVQGIMHNKFVVVDTLLVWTGSANFTKSVLHPSEDFQNDENILTLYSPYIAQLYKNEFVRIARSLCSLYGDLIGDGQKLSEELKSFVLAAYNKFSDFKKILENPETPYTQTQQKRLRQFFPNLFLNQMPTAVTPSTPIQRQSDTLGIEQQLRSMNVSVGQSPQTKSWRDDSVTYAQIDKLKELGVSNWRGVVSTKGEASDLINSILAGTRVAQQTVNDDSSSEEEHEEPATQRQINLLSQLGVRIERNLTKDQASALITRLRR